MKDQIEQLKTELQEFIELSKTATAAPWYVTCMARICSLGRPLTDADNGKTFTPIPSVCQLLPEKKEWTDQQRANGDFIARSRNISPAMAECLLSSINNLELIHEQTGLGEYHAWDALEQILTIWEATK